MNSIAGVLVGVSFGLLTVNPIGAVILMALCSTLIMLRA
jgi:hypothetical protein